MSDFKHASAARIAKDMVANWDFPAHITKEYGYYEYDGCIFYDLEVLNHVNKIFKLFTPLELILYRKGPIE